jgi:RNA polymerase sigma-70 factor, ECF subfamily
VAHPMDLNAPHANAKHSNRGGLSRTRAGRPGQVAVDHNLHRRIEALIPRLTRYARVLTRDVVAADDLVQDCLARALGKIHLWEQGSDLRAWLFTILHHQHVSLARRDARQRAGTEWQKWQKRHPAATLSPNQIARLELRDLQRALAKLPEEQRSVILLVGLEGLRYEEAASLVNLPVGTVRSRVARGRETLRTMTELFPGRHSRRPAIAPNPVIAPNLDSPRRSSPRGNHFRPTPTEPISAPRSPEVFQ